ncbi:hypothetical protein QI122_03430 [Staphylococcus saprophyticus]|nr:hypothetical protein [Staphylococcus saprophyticus]
MNSVHDIDITELEDEFGDLLRELYSDKEFKTPTADIEKSKSGKKFLDNLAKIDRNFLPYHTLTQFVYDPEEERQISDFATIIYETIKNKNNINDETKDKALKIRQHLLLAEQQKNSLYYEQQDEIGKINRSIKSTKKSMDENQKQLKKTKKIYDNMLSQYISILGIFAAILMTAFGGIQAFTAIYNDNTFNLIDSLLIACVGFLGILLMMFLLLNSIAKLSGKSLNSNNSKQKWYLRHPTIINSFIILTSLSILLISYKISINPPTISWWGWIYAIPIVYLLIMIRAFNNFTYKEFFKDIIKRRPPK